MFQAKAVKKMTKQNLRSQLFFFENHDIYELNVEK
jgi:hypothetical protein